MKSSLASVLTSRTTRVAALFFSVSAIAFGGFFISQAYAVGPSPSNLTVTKPDGTQYWRGMQTITWVASTTATTMQIGYTTAPGLWQNEVATGVVITDGSKIWNTSSVPSDGTYYIKLKADFNPDDATSNAFGIDNTKPVTTLATSTLPDTTGWYNIVHPVSNVVLTCTDGGSGCSVIHYRWDAGTPIDVAVSGSPATATILAANVPDGVHALTYWSEDAAVDNTGAHNIETPAHSVEFKVDTIAPAISSYTLNGLGANAYFNPAYASVTIALVASEPVKTSRLNVCAGTSCGSVTKFFTQTASFLTSETETWNGHVDGTATIAADGPYMLSAHLEDAAGNTSIVDLSTSRMVIDTAAPSISSFTSPAANVVYKSTTPLGNEADALSFTSSDAGSAITCSYNIDGTATSTTACISGTSVANAAITGLSDGRHTIVLSVVDAAGNATYSAPVSFVFDNNNTLTVGTVPAQDFGNITDAVNASTANDTIDIFLGTYTENVNVNKSLTLKSHGSNPVGTTIKGLMTVTSNTTTVEYLSFTNPDASTALLISGANNVSVRGNAFDTIGTTLLSGSAQAINVNGGSSTTMSGITISKNTISNVGSLTLAYSGVPGSGTSAKGIYIGDSTGTNTISGVTIDQNTISNIKASTAAWTTGRGAYGILVNHSTSGVGSTGVSITNNTINTLEGLWAHAIGLEGNTPGATVTGNIISGLIDHKAGVDHVGVMLESNANAGSVTISTNQFATNIIGVANVTTATTTATGNWWGSIEGPTHSSNPHGNGAAVSDNVSFTSWCTDATCSPLDTVAPTATLGTPPANPTNVTSPSFIVGSAAGDVVYYKYTLDGSPLIPVDHHRSVPIAPTPALAPGSHTLALIGRDQAGNWQVTPTTYTWVIDTTKPVLTEVTPVTTPTSNKTPSYVFSTTKAGTIIYAGDCVGSVTSTSTPGIVTTTFAALTDGFKSCAIVLTDSAGNSSLQLNVTPFRIDTIAPSVNAGTDKYVKSVVTQNDAIVTDDGSGVATYAWSLVSGPTGGVVTFGTATAKDTTISASVDGTYTLRLSATDAAGNVGHGDMTFTWDTTKPVITTVAPITHEATGVETPLTPTLLATVTDALDPAPTITNNAPATFPVGDIVITWTATDKAGNQASAQQRITIVDSTAPYITAVSNVVAEATEAAGHTVNYILPTALDLVDGSVPVICTPAIPHMFAIGDTLVTCTATDAAHNTATTTFMVTVHDTTAPVIQSHADVFVVANRLSGAEVTYTVPNSTDAVDGTVPAVCLPVSGDVFPIGVTTVNCTKTDAHGNVATPTSFTVTVVPGALVRTQVSASPTSLSTADTSTITVTGQDHYGNTVTSDSSTIAVLSADNGGSLATTILTLVHGVQTTTLSKSSAGAVNVNAASGILIPTQVVVTFTGATIPDTTAPVITNIQTTNISPTSVRITWTTNENSSSQVEYGATSGYGSSSAFDSELLTSHVVTLTGLPSSTGYHFRVKSADLATNLATSGDNTFMTNVDNSTAVISVTGISSISTFATADGTFEHGFKWVFHVTVPTTETQFAMKFADFTNGATGTIPAAGDIRFYSAQSSDAADSTTAKMITVAGVYTTPITLLTDLDPLTAGRQIDVTVEMKVPTGTPGGSYSTSYGISSTPISI